MQSVATDSTDADDNHDNEDVKLHKPSTLRPQSDSSTNRSFTQKPITGFIDFITDDELNTLQEDLAKAIFSSGTPLSMVGSPYWKKFFENLRPSFKMPTRQNIAGKQLDELYDDMQSDVLHKISEGDTACRSYQMDKVTSVMRVS